jgi:hypothetical protein
MKRTIGWLTVDGDRAAENPFTGEALAYREELKVTSDKRIHLPKTNRGIREIATPALGDPLVVGSWQRYEYAHENLRIPLAIGVAKRSDAQVVVVDYSLSAELADGSLSSDAGGHFSYGLWRRLEEFVLDALVLLKLDQAQPIGRCGVVTLGGWVNGSWRTDLRTSLQLNMNPRDFDAKYLRPLTAGYLLHEPVPVCSVDIKPLPLWTFHPYLQTKADATLPADLPEDLLPIDYDLGFLQQPQDAWPSEGGFTIPPRFRAPALSRNQRQSIVGRSPCLYANEDGRLLYMRMAEPTGNESRKFQGSGYTVRTNWIYASNELTCGIDLQITSSGVMRGYRPSFVSTSEGALRRVIDLRTPPRDVIGSESLSQNFEIDLDIPTHRETWNSITDGMLVWGGSTARHHSWSNDVSLLRPLMLWRPTYLFGYVDIGCRCSWLEEGVKSA